MPNHDMLVQIWACFHAVSASCALNFTQDNSEKYWNVCISSRTKPHYFSTCNLFLQCAFRSFLLIWKDMPCVLICGSTMRSPCHFVMPSACPGHPDRRGDYGKTKGLLMSTDFGVGQQGVPTSKSADLCRRGSHIACADDPPERSDRCLEHRAKGLRWCGTMYTRTW
jgi:hypothetical protein